MRVPGLYMVIEHKRTDVVTIVDGAQKYGGLMVVGGLYKSLRNPHKAFRMACEGLAEGGRGQNAFYAVFTCMYSSTTHEHTAINRVHKPEPLDKNGC